MTKTKVNKSKNSQRGLNQLLRLYERNYQRIIAFFPIQDSKNNINYLIPEGVFDSEIKLSCKKLSSHTSVVEIKKNKTVFRFDWLKLIYYLLKKFEITCNFGEID